MQDDAQESRQSGEDETEVVADGGEDDVGVVAGAALEPASAEMAFVLHVSDYRLDGGAPPELTFDDAEHAARFWPERKKRRSFAALWPR